MTRDWQIDFRGEALILGIEVAEAVLDVVTDRKLLTSCLALLQSPHSGLVHTRMGQFGEFPVTLNLDADDSVSIFIDGPDFAPGRCQSAAVYVDKERLCKNLKEVLFVG